MRKCNWGAGLHGMNAQASTNCAVTFCGGDKDGEHFAETDEEHGQQIPQELLFGLCYYLPLIKLFQLQPHCTRAAHIPSGILLRIS